MMNFRPFFGHHSIDLSTGSASNLVVIFGENMYGKTALLNALRWVLYGRAINRLGEAIPIYRSDQGEQLLNALSVRNGDYTMEVALTFDHDDAHYELRRSATADTDPQDERGFITEAHLLVDGNAVASEDIETRVNGILHQDISRFSLFDGEMLNEYEKLLARPDHGVQAVKDAIEKILGLPAITRGKAQLGELAREYEKELNAQLRKEKRNDQIIVKLEELDDHISAVEHDLGNLRDLLMKATEERTEAEKDLKEHERLASTLSQIHALESEITSMDKTITGENQSIQNILSSNWWVPLTNGLTALRKDLENKIENQIQALKVSVLREQIERSKELGRCVVCDAELNERTMEHIEEHSRQYSLDGSHEPDPTYVAQLTEEMKFVSSLSGERTAERLVRAEQHIMELETEKEERSSRAEELHRSVGDLAKGGQEIKLGKFHEADENVRDIELRMKSADTRHVELCEERDSEQRRLTRGRTGDRETRLRAAISRLSHDAFEGAIEGFRKAAKESVSLAAGEIFGQLTTEKRYTGLQINENYGLTILDSLGQEVSGRSAGAEQIVALALIGGLNMAAVRGEAPVVMDTNFGRLDRGHRENILRWVAGLRQQVILLVHSGELENTDLDEFKITVARKYRIERISEWESEVYPYDA